MGRMTLLGAGRAPATAGYSIEAQQFFDRVSDPGSTRKNLYATLIDGLVADGLWSKIDALYILAAADNATALTNLKSSSFGATESATAPTFTADQGYAGNGSSSYLNSNFTPSTGGSNYVLNSASFGTYILTNRTTDAAKAAMGVHGTIAGGTNNGYNYILPRWSDGNYYFKINASSASGNIAGASSTAMGMWINSRTGSGAFAGYKNGSSLGTATDASDALSDHAFFIGAMNNNGSAGEAFNTDLISAALIASGFNATEAGNCSTRVNNHHTSLGINVY